MSAFDRIAVMLWGCFYRLCGWLATPGGEAHLE